MLAIVDYKHSRHIPALLDDRTIRYIKQRSYSVLNTMPDFNQGQIYAIRSQHTPKVYIGSTCQSLRKRFNTHRGAYAHHLRGEGRVCSSFEILKYYDANIELIEVYPCASKSELLVREGHYIRTLDCVNSNIPGRTLEERAEAAQKRYAANPAAYKERARAHYDRNKDINMVIRRVVAARIKAARESNNE